VVLRKERKQEIDEGNDRFLPRLIPLTGEKSSQARKMANNYLEKSEKILSACE
jgi:hypothetical protein